MRARLALVVLLSAAGAQAASVSSRDGSFSISLPGGWTRAPARRGGPDLELRRGARTLSLSRLPKSLDAKGLKANIELSRFGLAKKGLRPSPASAMRLPGGAGYLSKMSNRGVQTSFGCFTASGVSYSFSAKGLDPAAATRLLSGIGIARPATPAKPPPVVWTGEEIRARVGLAFPRAEGWRYGDKADGWFIAEGPGLGFAVNERLVGAPSDAPGQDIKTLTARFLARYDASLPADGTCKGDPLQGSRLVNGWRILYKQYSCARPPSEVSLAGVLVAEGPSLYALTARYPDKGRLPLLLAHLARGRAAPRVVPVEPRLPSSPAAPAPEEGPASPPPRGIPGMLVLVAAALGLALLSRGAVALRDRRLPPQEDEEAAPAGGAVFPIRCLGRWSPFGRRYLLSTAAGKELSASWTHAPARLCVWGTGGLLVLLVLLNLAGLHALRPPLSYLFTLAAAACGALLTAGLALIAFLRPTLAVLQEDGRALASVRQGRLRFGSAETFDSSGSPALILRRSGPRALGRRWTVYDAEERPVLLVRETGLARTLLRRLFGHAWGSLRSRLVFLTPDGAPAGGLDRRRGTPDRFRLDLSPRVGREADPLALCAAVLFIEALDRDRWHPWWS